MDNLSRLRAARGFILDMDGVLYRGQAPLPGARELLDSLALRDIPYRFVTNNSTATPTEYVAKLGKIGIDTSAGMLITSGTATRAYLENSMPDGGAVFAVGEPALYDQLFTDSSLRDASSDHTTADAVVVALDRKFDYDKLYKANAAIRGGARYVATNTDVTLPTEEGLVPGSGSILGAVTAAVGHGPEVVGKPEPLMFQMACDQMGISAAECVAIGDRLDTDIVAADVFGALSVMVLTGVSTRDDVAKFPVKPDLIFTDLPAMLDALVGE